MSDRDPMRLPRRDFLRSGAFAALTAGAASGGSPHAASSPPSASTTDRAAPAAIQVPRTARNVIFLVADGASTGTITLADLAIRQRRGEPSWWCRLWTMPGAHRAAMQTSAADSLVTDSAAGASAWGIGRKVNNNVVNLPPDGSTPTPLLVHARASGRATGLVSTTRVTDATPAGFVANVPKRTLETIVAEQIIERGVDVVLGGGRRSFSKEILDDPRIEHAIDAATLRAAAARIEKDPTRRLLGLFSSGSMPYELDRPEALPTLAEMTTVALARMSQLDRDRPASQGFVIQIEGGRIDHAAHDNDAAALIADQIAFDDAIGAAFAFARDRDDTLVVVTTDHGNANPGLTLYGRKGNEAFTRLLSARRSFDWIKAQLKQATGRDEAILAAAARNAEQHAASRPGLAGSVAIDPAAAAEGLFERLDRPDHANLLSGLVQEAMGVTLSPEEVTWVLRRLAGDEIVSGFTESDTPEAALGAVLANHFGVAFMSTNHTADLVDAVAIGPGAERMTPLLDNTELHGVVIDALGL